MSGQYDRPDYAAIPHPGFENIDQMLAKARAQARKAEDYDMLLKCLAFLARGTGGVIEFPRKVIADMPDPEVGWTIEGGLVVFRVTR